MQKELDGAPGTLAESGRRAELATRTKVFTIGTNGVTQDGYLSWTGEDYKCVAPLQGTTLYVIDRATNNLMAQNVLTGEKKLLSDKLPETDKAYLDQKIGDWLFVDLFTPDDNMQKSVSLRYAVNVQTGETRECTLHYLHQQANSEPIPILQAADGKLMVIMEERPISVPDVGTDGKAYLRQTAQRIYAFISLEDYLNNVPSFTECTLLPSAV